VVSEVSIVSDDRADGSDPLKAEALEMGPRVDEGREDKLDKVKVALDEGEAGERGGGESHGEGPSLSQ